MSYHCLISVNWNVFFKNGDTCFQFLYQYLLKKIASPYFKKQAELSLF